MCVCALQRPLLHRIGVFPPLPQLSLSRMTGERFTAAELIAPAWGRHDHNVINI